MHWLKSVTDESQTSKLPIPSHARMVHGARVHNERILVSYIDQRQRCGRISHPFDLGLTHHNRDPSLT